MNMAVLFKSRAAQSGISVFVMWSLSIEGISTSMASMCSAMGRPRVILTTLSKLTKCLFASENSLTCPCKAGTRNSVASILDSRLSPSRRYPYLVHYECHMHFHDAVPTHTLYVRLFLQGATCWRMYLASSCSFDIGRAIILLVGCAIPQLEILLLLDSWLEYGAFQHLVASATHIYRH